MTGTRQVTIAVVQAAFEAPEDANVRLVTDLVRQAASKGASVVLVPELFEGPYFCRHESARFFALARPLAGHPTITHFSALAAKLEVVIPVSFFEKSEQAYFNSVAVIDAGGDVLGVYRKSHIPDGPGYEEKFYFRPGDTGFRVWPTRHGRLGIGICWDQWFPECARAMVLLGADILLYPTAIGSEPEDPGMDTKDPWQRAMVGHAVSNVVPVAAANRVGTEGELTFYGHSFITDQRGDMVAELGRTDTGIGIASFDLNAIRRDRAEYGFFRDRRPDLYGPLTTTGGKR